jgi:competence protein ComEA
VPRRARPDPQTAALRLAALVPPSGPAGWVPPAEPAPQDAGPPDEMPPDAGPPEFTTGAGDLMGMVRARVATAGLDPGRRGVLALLLVGAVAALVAGAVQLRGRPHELTAPPALVRAGTPAASSSPTGEVVVSVAGTVRRPGLVHLPAGSRVDDAVRAAGGLTAGGQVGLLNLARRLVDGEQVLVGVAAAGATGASGAAVTGGLLDLNAATADAIDGLPGIGPVLAQRIVDWRTEHGRFASVDQLREVPGIGESKYAQLKSKVTV